MATVAATPEILADVKAEEAKPETTALEAAEDAQPVSEASTSAADASGDVTMSDADESDKKLRAVRQSTSLSIGYAAPCIMTLIYP